MEVANASMYDGASALAEAVLMAVRIQGRSTSNRVLVTGALHPFYRKTLDTIVQGQNIELITLPFDEALGTCTIEQLSHYDTEDICALVIAQPNFFGNLEPVDAMSDWAHHHHIISIACVNPVSLGLLKPPGDWGKHGVDIVCGEGQPFGVPMASGGPYFGFFSTRMQYVRQMPGRLVGRTLDAAGEPGFTLTLQAREQHIRRAKAKSNICTNQGLLVTAATIHMSLLGAHGLQQVAMRCHQNTRKLASGLTQLAGVTQVFRAPFFHEVLLAFNRPVDIILQQLQQAGIDGGYRVETDLPKFSNTLLVCATEMRTDDEIALFITTVADCLKI
jgi:glycine dehydrogenase subunit 1